jgi:hypothetical protein
VEIDPLDPLFDQRIVGTFTPSSMNGLEYDSVRNRVLAMDTAGQTYTVDQNTAATSPLTDFSNLGEPFFTALAFDGGQSPPKIYASQNGTENNLIVEGVDSSGLYDLSNQFFYSAFLLNRGVSIAPNDFSLYAVRRDQFNGLDRLISIEKVQGTVLQDFTIFGASNVSGIAFHPVTGVLFGTTETGTLIQIDKTTGAASVLKSYASNENVAVRDLAFIPVTPTPTPTNTPTPTLTPTPTATICPTFSAECGCNQKPIDLDKGSSTCGPADTLTKVTVPEAPTVVSGANTVTLILQNFSAVSDGKGIDILSSESALSAQPEEDAISEARRKASIRYDVTLKNTSSRTRDAINKQTRRNQVSFRKLPPGNYSARYRVTIIRNKKEIGSSRYSPRTKFKVRQSRKEP